MDKRVKDFKSKKNIKEFICGFKKAAKKFAKFIDSFAAGVENAERQQYLIERKKCIMEGAFLMGDPEHAVKAKKEYEQLIGKKIGRGCGPR